MLPIHAEAQLAERWADNHEVPSPSPLHEALVLLFRNRPVLAAELLREALGQRVPRFGEARVASGERTEVEPASYRADLVIELFDGDAVTGAVIVEVQLGVDPQKRFTWPLYVASVRAERQCPVTLLVVAPDPKVRKWAATQIPLGHPGLSLEPVVLGSESIPAVTDVGTATNDPELAVLSAMAYGDAADEELAFEVAWAALRAAGQLDEDVGMTYARFTLRFLNDATRRKVEEAMKLQGIEEKTDLEKRLEARGEARGRAEGEARGRAEGEARGEARGRVEGKQQAVLEVLEARGLPVSAKARARVTACTDLDTLDTWLVRAVAANAPDEIFSGG